MDPPWPPATKTMVHNPAMWAAAPSRYGAVQLGFCLVGLASRIPGWDEMQGVNDQGLYHDLLSMPCTPGIERTPAFDWRGPVYPKPEATECTVTTTCATVEEVLAFPHARDYARILTCAQVLVADCRGHAAVQTGTGDAFRSQRVRLERAPLWASGQARIQLSALTYAPGGM